MLLQVDVPLGLIVALVIVFVVLFAFIPHPSIARICLRLL
jgi:hypothetical protein